MSDILCVTNRSLCQEDFFARIEKIAAAKPLGIILREKDLTEPEYQALAERVLTICAASQTLCILHSHIPTAIRLKADALHLPLPLLRQMTDAQKKRFQILGASYHSIEEAAEAQALGCSYLTAGHIFETDCKKGLAGRGIPFLKSICQSVSIPVYAIGGIQKDNAKSVRNAGASGICIMSSAMQRGHIPTLINSLSKMPITNKGR